MANEEEEKQITYAVEAEDGVVLRAHPLALYQEWARRYGATRRPYTGYSYQPEGEGLRPVPFPCEVFWVPNAHDLASQARREAHCIYRMHRINESNVGAYSYFRQQLEQAHYSQEQLDSLNRLRYFTSTVHLRPAWA